MGHEPFPGPVVAITQITTATTMSRLAILIQLNHHRVGRRIELTFHVAAKIEIAAMSHPFQFAELAGR